jgi:hypothetical protein
LSDGRYLLGMFLVVTVAAASTVTARGLRRRFAPALVGPPAWLADAIASLAVVEVVAQVLGSVGLLRSFAFVPAMVGVGLTGLLVGRGCPTPPSRPSPPSLRRMPPASWIAGFVAVGAVAVVGAEWSGRVVQAIRHGITDADSVSYHLPFAARFAHSGSLTYLNFVGPAAPTAFHPLNSELFHTLGIVLLGRDVLSPLLNMGWLVLALLAAWCVGRDRGAGPAALVAAAAVLAVPIISRSQPGSAESDVASAALLLAAVAMVLTADDGPLVCWAGGAAGLALGAKLTMPVPVGLLVLGVLIAASRGSRRSVGLRFGLPLLGTGSFWYLRNLFRTGSPVPSLHLPFFPSPYISALKTDANLSLLSHGYLFHHWSSIAAAVPSGLGGGWIFLFALSAAGLVGHFAPAVRRRRLGSESNELKTASRAGVVVSVVGVGGALGYLATPTGGYPPLFVYNLRYLVGPLLVGAVMGARVIVGKGTGWRAVAGACVFGVVLVLSASTRGDNGAWVSGGRALATITWTAAIGALWVIYRGVRLAPRAIMYTAILASVVLAVGVGLPVERSYLRNRYRGGGSALAATWAFAQGLHGQRIALTGIVKQFPYYGEDLSNVVNYDGRRGPHGEFEDWTDCSGWKQVLAAGHYHYLFLGTQFPGEPPPIQMLWAVGDPALVLLMDQDNIATFRIQGQPSAAACKVRGP